MQERTRRIPGGTHIRRRRGRRGIRLDSRHVTSKEFIPQTKTRHNPELATDHRLDPGFSRWPVGSGGRIALRPRIESAVLPRGLILVEGRKLGG